MNTIATLPSSSTASADPENAPATWRLEITAAPEPLLLARVLQKLAVPEIGLLAVDYDAGVATGKARAILRFRAAEARARLAAVRCARLLSVRAADLLPCGPEPSAGQAPPAPDKFP